jgi:prephenate dehydrogenase
VDKASVLAHAAGSGAVDKGAEGIAEAGPCDLLILAAPIRQNVQLLVEASRHLPGTSVVTDVGGTKRDITAAAAGRPDGCAPFVGGHPIGGAEHGGFAFARVDLFRDRPWIFTPAGGDTTAALDRLFALARGLGARPTTMDASEHDRLMAFLSHLPQLTSSVLMETVGRAVDGERLRLAGRGLVDTTRLASSPAGIWRDVCASNGDVIGEALDALIARLTELRATVAGGESVETIFEEAARWRAELMRERE